MCMFCFPKLSISPAAISHNARTTLATNEFWLWPAKSLYHKDISVLGKKTPVMFWLKHLSLHLRNHASAQCNYICKTARGSERWWAEHIPTEHLFWQQWCSESGISQRHKTISSAQNPISKAAGRNDATLLCGERSLETNTGPALHFRTCPRHPRTASREDLGEALSTGALASERSSSDSSGTAHAWKAALPPHDLCSARYI